MSAIDSTGSELAYETPRREKLLSVRGQLRGIAAAVVAVALALPVSYLFLPGWLRSGSRGVSSYCQDVLRITRHWLLVKHGVFGSFDQIERLVVWNWFRTALVMALLAYGVAWLGVFWARNNNVRIPV